MANNYSLTPKGKEQKYLSHELSEACIKPSPFEKIARSLMKSRYAWERLLIIGMHNDVYSRRSINPIDKQKWESTFNIDSVKPARSRKKIN